MDLVDDCLEKTLEKWAQTRSGEFPNNANKVVWENYYSFKGVLRGQIYPNVSLGAANNNNGAPITLTCHGEEHINTVIKRASQLVLLIDKNTPEPLSPYEILVLLNAILIHDIGNIGGRIDHAKRSSEITNTLSSHGNLDPTEKRCTANIALAHSGPDGFENARLPETENIHGQKIRPLLLASILRKADELADDRTRSHIDLVTRSDANIVPESKIHHWYSHCLHSVTIDGQTRSVLLDFEMFKDDICKTFSMGDNQQFLLDEILSRTLKTFKEIKYCNSHLFPEMRIERVKVKIQVYEAKEIHEASEEISYVLEEKGYPKHFKCIFDICPELREWGKNNVGLSGQSLSEKYCQTESGGNNDNTS